MMRSRGKLVQIPSKILSQKRLRDFLKVSRRLERMLNRYQRVRDALVRDLQSGMPVERGGWTAEIESRGGKRKLVIR